MEAKLVATLAACLLLSFIYRGDAQCTVSDLAVTQTAMPGKAGGYPQFTVTVENKCICTQIDVKLECTGFNSSVVVVDPAGVITSDGDNGPCSLNDGSPVHNSETVTFNYAWSERISFKPVGSTIACSIPRAPSPTQAPGRSRLQNP